MGEMVLQPLQLQTAVLDYQTVNRLKEALNQAPHAKMRDFAR